MADGIFYLYFSYQFGARFTGWGESFCSRTMRQIFVVFGERTNVRENIEVSVHWRNIAFVSFVEKHCQFVNSYFWWQNWCSFDTIIKHLWFEINTPKALNYQMVMLQGKKRFRLLYVGKTLRHSRQTNKYLCVGLVRMVEYTFNYNMKIG